jgi:hypothetical protein
MSEYLCTVIIHTAEEPKRALRDELAAEMLRQILDS